MRSISWSPSRSSELAGGLLGVGTLLQYLICTLYSTWEDGEDGEGPRRSLAVFRVQNVLAKYAKIDILIIIKILTGFDYYFREIGVEDLLIEFTV